MHLREFIHYHIRKKRSLASPQLAGFALMGAAATVVQHPASIVLSYINALYVLSISPFAWAAAFFTCGYALAWHRRAGSSRFFLLTLPVLLYSCVQWIYFFTNANAASTPAYFMLMLFICLQVTNSRQEVWASWMKLSDLS